MRSQAEFIENLGPRGHGNSLGGGCGVGEGDLFGIAKEQQTGASHRGAVRRKRLRMMDDIIRESWESKLMGSRSVWTSLNCSMRKPPLFFFLCFLLSLSAVWLTRYFSGFHCSLSSRTRNDLLKAFVMGSVSVFMKGSIPALAL